MENLPRNFASFISRCVSFFLTVKNLLQFPTLFVNKQGNVNELDVGFISGIHPRQFGINTIFYLLGEEHKRHE